MKRRARLQKGFTLVELMVVVMILGILIAVITPSFAESVNRASLASVKANAHALQMTVEAYNVDNGLYPSRASDIMSHSAYKDFLNPFTQKGGTANNGNDGAWWTNNDGAADVAGGYADSDGSSGLAIYVGLDADDNATTSFLSATGGNGGASPTLGYLIYGCDKYGMPIQRFLLSAGEPPANARSLVGL